MSQLTQLLSQNSSGPSYRGRNPTNAQNIRDQKSKSTCGKCGVAGTKNLKFE